MQNHPTTGTAVVVGATGIIGRAEFVRLPDSLEGFFRRFDDYRRARINPTF